MVSLCVSSVFCIGVVRAQHTARRASGQLALREPCWRPSSCVQSAGCACCAVALTAPYVPPVQSACRQRQLPGAQGGYPSTRQPPPPGCPHPPPEGQGTGSTRPPRLLSPWPPHPAQLAGGLLQLAGQEGASSQRPSRPCPASAFVSGAHCFPAAVRQGQKKTRSQQAGVVGPTQQQAVGHHPRRRAVQWPSHLAAPGRAGSPTPHPHQHHPPWWGAAERDRAQGRKVGPSGASPTATWPESLAAQT